ncbi:hypothetical protein Lesp02_52850 [Lentzea sp. NBRC 105346]|uniref:tachylectin-related carbohydrate-binding protein n=1 Tax=Lentzea sp. NBRC 105346 TaxID=3032205 RepID=UPI00249FE95C|nr:tachylectin-related carbohydrate-binding protein [Lentzea sp. NBRC 105346]GLZ33097.1 hypothetical protein Lesp02_52850 [Lentzea sp. NBRC 105346]
MTTKFWGVAALAATMTAGLAAVAAPSASAIPSLACKTRSHVFTLQTDGDLWLYDHMFADRNTSTISGATQIGSGWSGRLLVGGDGGNANDSAVYNITPGGDLRQYWWTYNTQGSGGTWKDNAAFKVVRTGFQDFLGARRDLITADKDGSLYYVRNGLLLRDTSDFGVGRTITMADGFDRFDLIVASGGVIYGRTPTGEVWRYRYDAKSQRFIEPTGPAATGWNAYTKFTGPGGGAIYATGKADGKLYQLWDASDTDDTVTWGPTKQIGAGLASDVDTAGAPTDCIRTSDFTIPAATPYHAPDRATAIFDNYNGKLELFDTSDDKHLVRFVQNADGTFAKSVEGAAVDRVTAVHGYEGGAQLAYVDTDGLVQAPYSTSVSTKLNPDVWGGVTAHAPAIAQTESGRTRAFFTDAKGQLWQRNIGGRTGEGWDWRPWRVVPGATMFARPVAIGLSDDTYAVGTIGPNKQSVTVWVNGTKFNLPAPGRVESQPALVEHNGAVRVFFTDSDADVYTATIKNGVASDWAKVPGITSRFSGVSATVAGGHLEIVARQWDDSVAVSTDLGPAVVISDVKAANASSITTRKSGERVIAFRDSSGSTYLYRSTATGYTGGKIG